MSAPGAKAARASRSRASRLLLMIEDDELFAFSVKDFLSGAGLTVQTARTLAEARRLLGQVRPDVVLLDQHLPDGEGVSLCEELLRANPHAKIIFNTAYPSFENAVEAIRRGAFDYLSKPIELGQLQLAVRRAVSHLDLERIASAKRLHDAADARSAELVGDSPAMREVRNLLQLAGEVDSPLLLTGETGTGKTVAARAVHLSSARRDQEFVAVNAAALPASLIENELFGHERGAFTGAEEAREGLFEMADGGTLLLDEIGEMPLPLQSRLLTVLEDRAVRRIGGQARRQVDFRFIAATNRDLDEARRKGEFRNDLYYRLDVLRVRLPPLRERREDLPALVAHFLGRLAPPGRKVEPLAPAELEALAAYDWPGNLRELSNVLERALLVQREGPLRPSRLLPQETGHRRAPPSAKAEGGEEVWDDLTFADIERRVFRRAVERCGGNLTEAARHLGISLSTLRRRFPPGSPERSS